MLSFQVLFLHQLLLIPLESSTSVALAMLDFEMCKRGLNIERETRHPRDFSPVPCFFLSFPHVWCYNNHNYG